MQNHYHTLRALAAEWQPLFAGYLVGDAFSQARDELTLAFAAPEHETMLRISTAPAFPFIFRTEGYARARRNAVTLFQEALDLRVEHVEVAHRDRVLFIRLSDGFFFQIQLFGPRPNVFLVDEHNTVVESFQQNDTWQGQPGPTPRPAPEIPTLEDFRERWRERSDLAQSLAATVPFLDRTLAAEVLHRTGPEGRRQDEAAMQRLFARTQSLLAALENPQPHLYETEPPVFSLIPLAHLSEKPRVFETVDEAVRVFVRRTLAHRRFRTGFDPLEKALAATHDRLRRSADAMLDELAKPSRADRYEQWGHLLMARPNDVLPGTEEVTLPDMFAEEETPVTIPLDPAKSAIENAERYYDKARRTRKAREHAEQRWEHVHSEAEQAAALLEELHTLTDHRAVEQFQKTHAEALARLVGGEASGGETVPFRRFDVGGFEVWVGKNAKQNDLLTFRHARPTDFWLHARGVPGSHVVLRRPNREERPPKSVLEQAAAIAAHFSDARTSGLAPVILTERKYVRRAKGAPPGAVLVQREEVLLVPPGLPEATSTY